MNNVKETKIMAGLMAFVILFTMFIPTSSSAAVYKKLKYNTAPDIKVNVTKDKKAYLTIQDGNGLSTKNIKLYSIRNNKKIDLISNGGAQYSNDTSKTKLTYLINKEYTKETLNQFYLIAKDSTGNEIETYFYIRKLADGKFKMNYAPWVNTFSLTNNKIQFNIENGAHIKKIVVYDLNNNNKKLVEGTNTKEKAQIRLDYANQLKADKNGVYRIKIYTEDYQAQKAVRKMTFKIETTKK